MATVLDHTGLQQSQELSQPDSILGLDCLQGSEPIDDDLLAQLCSSEDIWNGIQFPELPDDLLNNFTSDLNQNSLNQFDDYPGLSTPPESPPENVGAVTSSHSLLPEHVQPVIDSSFPATVLSQLSGPLTPPQAPPITPTVPTLHCTSPTQNCNIVTTTSQEGVKNELGVITGSNGQLVRVLKSGEVIPISALLNNTQSTEFKQEVIGQKRLHPSSHTMNNTVSVTTTPTPHVKLSKRQQRLIKNRESASLSRLKKKEYVTSLESKLKEAALKNLALLKENQDLKTKVSRLQEENHTLRCSFSQPSSPLSSAPKPAMVLVLVLCFTIAIFPLRSYVSSPSPITSLSVPLNPSGRALMSVEDTEVRSSSSGHTSSSVSTSLGIQNINRWLERGGVHSRSIPVHHRPDTVCSCPVIADKHNATRAMIMNSELSVSFDREEMIAMNMLQEIEGRELSQKQQKNSLMIVNGVEQVNQQGYGGDCYCRSSGVFKYYKSLKKSMSRDLSNYYLVSFKDHLLLNAPLRNNTNNPVLSVIIPAHNGTYQSPHGSMAMLQLDCQVLDSKIFHIEIP